MKKVKQRKGTVAWTALAAALLCLGGRFVGDGITHVGPGVWLFGGAETDSYQEVIPEDKYRRECYLTGGVLILVGVVILGGAINAWKNRNGLEESWERTISNPNNVQEIRRHPDLYRDDFKQWIKENHPNLFFTGEVRQPGELSHLKRTTIRK